MTDLLTTLPPSETYDQSQAPLWMSKSQGTLKTKEKVWIWRLEFAQVLPDLENLDILIVL